MKLDIRPEDNAEAERLKLIALRDGRLHVESLKKVAADPVVPFADRQESSRPAKALKHLLRLGMKPKRRGK